MKIKQPSKIKHLLLIAVMLLNPILSSADTLYSEFIKKNIVLTINGDTSQVSSAETQASCHDEKSTTTKHQASNNADCCEEVCQCSASNCHASSVTITPNKSQILISNDSFIYLLNHYLSLVSAPSSPPPIV